MGAQAIIDLTPDPGPGVLAELTMGKRYMQTPELAFKARASLQLTGK